MLSVWSCEDFLVEEPTTELTEASFFDTEENAQLAVNAMYDPLGYGEATLVGNGGHAYEFVIGDMVSDDAEKGSTSGDQAGMQHLKSFIANGSTSNVFGLWNKHYVAISRANLVLANLPNAPLSDGIKAEFEAEARFIRAYSYFVLVRVFGAVPLFEGPVSTSLINERAFTRAPQYLVYQQIVEDFQFGVDNLPQKGIKEIGRANQGAAAAYLARAIMYQLGTDNTNGHTWSEVLNITDNFIAGSYGSYALTPNYAEIFELEGENNEESIFEIQAVDNGIGPFSQGPYIGTAWTVVQNPLFMGGWGFNTPTQDLVNTYESNDPRRHATAVGIGEFAYGVEMVASERNQTGYYHRKAIADPDTWITEKGSGENIRKFRYADILLMNAEAAYHTGNNAQAIQRLTEIRERASNSTFPKGWNPANPSGYETTGFDPLDNGIIPSGGDALLQFIWDERRRELGMEQLRFWELVRTGQFVDKMESLYGFGSSILDHAVTTDHPEDANQVIVNPIPVFPIPGTETVNWGIEQNRNY
jgi:hypothetical protein